MQLNPAEISELIKSRIDGLSASADIRNLHSRTNRQCGS